MWLHQYIACLVIRPVLPQFRHPERSRWIRSPKHSYVGTGVLDGPKLRWQCLRKGPSMTPVPTYNADIPSMKTSGSTSTCSHIKEEPGFLLTLLRWHYLFSRGVSRLPPAAGGRRRTSGSGRRETKVHCHRGYPSGTATGRVNVHHKGQQVDPSDCSNT